MAHIFFIDPISKLNIRKDTSLMMASEFKKLGLEVYLLFEEDFYIGTNKDIVFKVHNFKAVNERDGFYLSKFELKEDRSYALKDGDIIHMRIDPPFDMRYLRYLWMLDFIEKKIKVKVFNNPRGIMTTNEKVRAFLEENSVESFVGASISGFKSFINSLDRNKYADLILKPLDLYSGIGVSKHSLDDANLIETFKNEVLKFNGAIIAQPFMKEVYEGEKRAIYFNGALMGAILKKPKSGEFLSNIAQGASFEKIELGADLRLRLEKISFELLSQGINFIAFDILGERVTEINVTCPGLLVEVSYAHKKNFASLMGEHYL